MCSIQRDILNEGQNRKEKNGENDLQDLLIILNGRCLYDKIFTA